MFFTRSMFAFALCVGLLRLFTATAVAAAEMENAQEVRLAIVDNTVQVSGQDGRPLQELPILGEAPSEDTRDYFAIAEDMNFDGFADVRVLYSRGMVNLYYDAWLWNPESNAFVHNEDLREFSNPIFVPDAKSVHVYERGSATTYVQGELGWKNGRLVWLAKTVLDEAGDGENVVLSRYLREPRGELRLVCERTIPLENLEEERIGNACLPPPLPGLNLILDITGNPIDAAVLPNGEWWMREALPGWTLAVESRRLPAMEYGEEAVRDLIRRSSPEARDITISRFPALSGKITFPALKAEYLVGDNEDTRQYVSALVFTEEWSFWFVLNAPAGTPLFAEELAADNPSLLGADLKQDLETLLLGIEPANPFDGGFLPGFGPLVYIVGEDSPLRLSIMDGLVKIKKVVAPEDSRWVSLASSAYRYDGPGKVGDTPALLYSFGTDSWEKFTAMRHFGVDGAGTIYEMDSAGGGDYWQWDEKAADWCGEYRLGDVILRISNYRDGPFGMYTIFDFREGDKVLFDGTAAVRGRTANYMSLLFTIAQDDQTIVVTTDPESEDELGAEGLSRFTGVYEREETSETTGPIAPAESTGASDGAEATGAETLVLTFRGNPSTGYLWSWTASGDGAVKESDVEYRQDHEAPGSPASYRYSFVGEKAGKVALHFVYSRSDPENPTNPAKIYTLQVLPDQRIVLVDEREGTVGEMTAE